MPKSKNVKKKITHLTMAVLRYPSTGIKRKKEKKNWKNISCSSHHVSGRQPFVSFSHISEFSFECQHIYHKRQVQRFSRFWKQALVISLHYYLREKTCLDNHVNVIHDVLETIFICDYCHMWNTKCTQFLYACRFSTGQLPRKEDIK